MDFVRYGMGSASPRFLDAEHLMVRADELAVNIPGEDHHSKWHQTLEHDDAQLIAASPDLLKACQHALEFASPAGDEGPETWPPSVVEWEQLRSILMAAISKATLA
jgi:hypothetical protein